MRVKCLAQEHNTMSPARAQTRSARSRVKRTNHEATAPPTKLKLNSDKSELLVISSKYRPRPSLDSISISEQVVNSSVSARNLGLIVDDSLSLEEHVNSISKSCYYHIRRIAKI